MRRFAAAAGGRAARRRAASRRRCSTSGRGPVPDRPPLLLGARPVRALRLSLLRRAGARRPRGARAPRPASADRGAAEPADDELRRARRRRAASRSGSATRSTRRSSGAPRRGWERAAGRAARAPARPRGPRRRRRGARRARGGWSPAGSTRRCAPSSPAAPRAEVPFVLGLGATVVRGQIDLLAERPTASRPSSTTRPTRSPAARRPSSPARYAAQREVYALAVGAAAGARVVHVFLEAPDEPVIETFDADGLRAAREHLERRSIERMRARRVRGHGGPLRGALLRLPGGGAALPAARRGSRPAVSRLAVFGYASLVSPAERRRRRSAARSRSRRSRGCEGWTRGWTLGRDRRASEKTFARPDGSRARASASGSTSSPPPAPTAPNGVLIELTEAELERLDLREIRYDRVDVTDAIAGADGARTASTRCYTYTARPEHHHPTPPARRDRRRHLPGDDRGRLRRARPRPARALPPDHRPAAGRGHRRRPWSRDRIPPGNPRDW